MADSDFVTEAQVNALVTEVAGSISGILMDATDYATSIRRRWDFRVEADRSILQAGYSMAVGHKPPGFETGDVPSYSLTAGAAGPATPRSTEIDVMFGTSLDGLGIPIGSRCQWRCGVSFEVTTNGGTVPAAWPAAIPNFWEPSSLAGGLICTGYLGAERGWVPNFPSPQFEEYAGSWMWAADSVTWSYPTVLQYEDVWDGSAPGLMMLKFAALQNENAYNFYIYFLELQVVT